MTIIKRLDNSYGAQYASLYPTNESPNTTTLYIGWTLQSRSIIVRILSPDTACQDRSAGSLSSIQIVRLLLSQKVRFVRANKYVLSQKQCGGNGVQFSKHRPSGPMLSIGRFVHMCVCVCVCVCSLLSYRLNIFLPALP